MWEVHTETEERLSWAAGSPAEPDGVDTETLCSALFGPLAKVNQREDKDSAAGQGQ